MTVKQTGIALLLLAIQWPLAGYAQEKEKVKMRFLPTIELGTALNLNQTDINGSSVNNRLSTKNTAGYNAGVGITLLKPKRRSIMFSLHAGFKSNKETFVTQPTDQAVMLQRSTMINSLYLRPELSALFRLQAQQFLHFGLYLEPNWIITNSAPVYDLQYSKSATSTNNVLSSTTFYTWGRNNQSNSGVMVPASLLGISAGFSQTYNGVVKMLKLRLFFEMEPATAIGNDLAKFEKNRSYAKFIRYEDNNVNRTTVSTHVYLDKMMRAGVMLCVGL